MTKRGCVRRTRRRLRSIGRSQGRVWADAGGFDGKAPIEAGRIWGSRPVVVVYAGDAQDHRVNNGRGDIRRRGRGGGPGSGAPYVDRVDGVHVRVAQYPARSHVNRARSQFKEICEGECVGRRLAPPSHLVPDAQRATIARALAQVDLDPTARRVNGYVDRMHDRRN